MKKRQYESLFEIRNNYDIQKIKKPLTAFYSPKRTIRSLLAMPEVKEDMRKVISQGKEIEVYRDGNYFGLSIYDVTADGVRSLDYDHCFPKEEGLKMLDQGLDHMKYTRGDYSWLWIPPVILAVGGFFAGMFYGHWSSVWGEGTEGAIEKAELVYGALWGAGGGGIGLGVDAVVGGAQATKDWLEEPFRRINLAKKVKNGLIKK